MATSQDIASLRTSLSNLVTIVETQTAAWVAAGCPTTYSVDGESYDWNSWLESKTKAIDDLNTLINKLSSPWIVRSQGRA